MGFGEKDIDLLQTIGFQSYKSFLGNGPFEIETQKNMTLIIGRNNCGKSSLIDVISMVIGPDKKNIWQNVPKELDEVTLGVTLNARNLKKAFIEYAEYEGKRLFLKCGDEGYLPNEVQPDIYPESKLDKNTFEYPRFEKIAKRYDLFLLNVFFRRVSADRNILPEEEKSTVSVDENGNGATNIVRMFINNSDYDEGFVEDVILNELNKLMFPEAEFSKIRVQQIPGDAGTSKWEIFLAEKNLDRYALSKSGSGLKTILLILINLILVPAALHVDCRQMVFAFEEVENNLHPALQRRLFDYLYDFSVEKNVKIFLTSHSHIAINNYYGRDDAQIYHVVKNNGKSSLSRIVCGNGVSEVLNDLNVKASDLLQSNGIIWVEGPSDRVYILKWLRLFLEDIGDGAASNMSEKKLLEGRDFQFLYYGGRMLSHHTVGENTDNTDNLINILKTNRNAIVVMDSDKRKEDDPVNETKRRVECECKSAGIFCWITQGREIENYLPCEAVNSRFKCNLPQIGQYESFKDYILKLPISNKA